MTSLERLFKSNIRMSPGKSRKPRFVLSAQRAKFNRAAYTLAKLKEARQKRNQLTRNIEKLEREYYKLVRRAGYFLNANMRSGPLSPRELQRVHRMASIVKNISSAERTMRHMGAPRHIQELVGLATIPRVR